MKPPFSGYPESHVFATIINKMPVSSSQNHLLYMTMVAFVIAQLPGGRWPMVMMGLDRNQAPRENFQHAERKITAGKSKVTLSQLNLLKRMYYAHENGMENLPIFYIAVAAALIAHLPAKEANALGAFYIGSRLVYNACYILISEFAFSPIRTAVYWFGMLTCFSMIWRSAEIVASQRW